jgi:hypothetical protein
MHEFHGDPFLEPGAQARRNTILQLGDLLAARRSRTEKKVTQA